MAKSNADRQRDRRRRRKAGRAVLQVECDPGPIADWLVEQGALDAWDSEDRTKIAEALAKTLGRLVA